MAKGLKFLGAFLCVRGREKASILLLCPGRRTDHLAHSMHRFLAVLKHLVAEMHSNVHMI